MNNNNKPRIIGFAGRKRCGKTILANYIKNEENGVVITIANYLKQLCSQLMNISVNELIEKKDNGFTFDIIPDERWFEIIDKETNIGIDKIRNDLKNTHITSIRQLLQVIGTDLIRKYNENWHVEKMLEEINNYPNDTFIAIDDVRFPNEKEAIEKLSGIVFFIVRPNCLSVSNHISEISLLWQDFNDTNVIINNTTDKETLINNFKIHFKKDFNIYIPNSLFLNENPHFKQCSNFGYSNGDNFLIEDIVRQMKESDDYCDIGLLKYKTCNKEYAKEYVEMVDNRKTYLDKYYNEFTTNNPLIIENLKRFL